MSKPELVYSRKAAKDLDRIGVDSERLWGRNQTRQYLAMLNKVALSLTEFPERGSSLNDVVENCRKMRSGSHLIIYRHDEKTVEIIRVLHEQMDTPNRLG